VATGSTAFPAPLAGAVSLADEDVDAGVVAAASALSTGTAWPAPAVSVSSTAAALLLAPRAAFPVPVLYVGIAAVAPPPVGSVAFPSPAVTYGRGDPIDAPTLILRCSAKFHVPGVNIVDVPASAALSGSGTLTVTALGDGSASQAWTAYERLRQIAVFRREDWEESRAAGGTDGSAGALYSVYYQAEQAAEAAYLAWATAVRQQAITAGAFAGFGGSPFISGQYPPYQQPPSAL
jgi:hypothetical protein